MSLIGVFLDRLAGREIMGNGNFNAPWLYKQELLDTSKATCDCRNALGKPTFPCRRWFISIPCQGLAPPKSKDDSGRFIVLAS
jgi:hypothetical protein